MDGVVAAYFASANPHATVRDQLLNLRPRMVGEYGDQKAIEALSRRCIGNSAFEHPVLAIGLRRNVRAPGVYAATLRRRGTRCGVSGVERRSQISIAIARGASSKEMN